MTKKTAMNVEDTLEHISESADDYIRETHLFPGISELHQRTKIPEARLRDMLEVLQKRGDLSIVYQANARPTLYAPTYMMQEVFRAQLKPKWLEKYAFKEREDSNEQIAKAKEQLNKYDLLEGLLYRTDTPLEDSVAFALNLLNFEDVTQHKGDKANPDITFTSGGKRYIAEVKGKAKEANKDDILQLEGWIQQEVGRGSDPTLLARILFVNAYRYLAPPERLDFLTPEAKKFGTLYKSVAVTTPHLFEWSSEFLTGNLKADQARNLVVQGENYA